MSDILNSFDKDSLKSFSLNPEKSFETSSREPSSADETSSSTLKISNISVESSPFDSSKDPSHLRPSHQEVIAPTKGEKRLELGDEPFSLEEKSHRDYLLFKKRFVFFEKGSTCASSPIISFASKQHDCGSCDSEIDHHFRHQLLEEDPEEDKIQSSKIVGVLCGQSHQSNASQTPSKELSSNDNLDYEEAKDIQPSIHRKRAISSNNLVAPSPPSKEELKFSTSKVSYSRSEITSVLFVLNLVSNASSQSSL